MGFLLLKAVMKGSFALCACVDGTGCQMFSAMADSSAKLCPRENPKFAGNVSFKLAVIGYDHFCRECHSQSCVTVEVFCGPSSPWEYIVENWRVQQRLWQEVPRIVDMTVLEASAVCLLYCLCVFTLWPVSVSPECW